MIIDLQIKADKSQLTNGQQTRQSETASEKPRAGQEQQTMRENNYENTPILRTVDNLTIGDGLRHTAIGGGIEHEDEEVVFD